MSRWIDRPSRLNTSPVSIRTTCSCRLTRSAESLLIAVSNAAGQTEVRILDVENGDITASALLEQQSRVSNVRFPAPGSNGDLIVFQGMYVSLLTWPGLEQATTYNLGGQDAIQNPVFVGDQWIVGVGRQGGVERRRLPDGQRVPFPALIGGIHERIAGEGIAGISQEMIGSRFEDGWISEGVVYDDGLQTPQLLLRPWGFIRSERLALETLLRPRDTPSSQQATVGNAANRVHFDNSRMQLIAEPEAVQFVAPQGPAHSYQRINLDLWSLTTRQQVDSTPFCILNNLVNRRNSVRAFPAGDDACILANGRLYRWPLPRSTSPSPETTLEPEPGDVPQFGLHQSHLVADAAGQTVFEHSVTGGSPPYRFEVQGPQARREVLSLPIDVQTGNVTVDGSRAAEWIMTHLREPLQGAESESILEAYQTVAGDEFEKIVGRRPQGVPALLGMSVTVTDAEGRQATLPYEFFIELPHEEWLRRMRQEYDNQQQANCSTEAAGTGGGSASPGRAGARSGT